LNQWYPAKGVFNKSYPKDVILNEWGKAEEKLVVDYLGNLYVHSKERGSPERETFVVTILLLERIITDGRGVLFKNHRETCFFLSRLVLKKDLVL